jgi:hypothetical protein
MSAPYWPGDTFAVSFQNLTYNPSTNVLGITPFGNTVTLDNFQNIDVSGTFIVNPGTNSFFEVVGSNGLTVISQAPAGSAVVHVDTIKNVNNSTITTAQQGIPSTNDRYVMNYTSFDLAGTSTIEGSITILSSIGGGAGGVTLQSQGSASQFSVKTDGIMTSVGNNSINTFLPDAQNVYIQHFTVEGFQSQIHFTGGVGNESSISLVSGAGNSMGVSGGGIDLNPGSNKEVLLQSGFININNLALSNVSSINGGTAFQPVINYIDPYGPNITFSTIAGSTSNTQLKQFSTLAGHTYNVSVEYYTSNLGGGNADDNCILTLNNLTGGSPYGKTTYLDSWTVSQSQNTYRSAASIFYTALGNNPDNASAILVGNGQSNGNSQNIALAQLAVQDMGVATVAF